MNPLNTHHFKIFRAIYKSAITGYYADLGSVEIVESDDVGIIKLIVTPNEGVHSGIPYTITCKMQDVDEWPLLYIDSAIYDKIKTSQYLNNRGLKGEHKGICIKQISYAYPFRKHFKDLCGDKWENYVYYVITVFNNLPDFERGNGLKSNYKTILGI